MGRRDFFERERRRPMRPVRFPTGAPMANELFFATDRAASTTVVWRRGRARRSDDPPVLPLFALFPRFAEPRRSSPGSPASGGGGRAQLPRRHFFPPGPGSHPPSCAGARGIPTRSTRSVENDVERPRGRERGSADRSRPDRGLRHRRFQSGMVTMMRRTGVGGRARRSAARRKRVLVASRPMAPNPNAS